MLKRIIAALIVSTFVLSSLKPASAQEFSINDLPVPGTMVNLSRAYVPVMIKGLKVHPDNPLLFDFILDTGTSGTPVNSQEFKSESQKLIKYFLASLTIKEDDLWVNLSPYERDRIVPQGLGQTELGRDMLAQDYILKQLTASLIYPEKNLGKEFWNRVYTKAQQMYGTSDIPVNTFNKVWIIADRAKVLEHNNVGYVVGAHLKVMLEEDYLSLQEHTAISQDRVNSKNTHTIGSQVVRDIVLPALEKEVNRGQNFAPLRQIFYSMILATWYKQALKNALLNQVYSNKSKTVGILSEDPAIKEKIYQQYLKAYKKGVFNYIKEDMDTIAQQPIPRKYFSGGLRVNVQNVLVRATVRSSTDDTQADGAMAVVSTQMNESHPSVQSHSRPNAAMASMSRRRMLSVSGALTAGAFIAGNLLPEYHGKQDGEMHLLSGTFNPAKKNLLFIIGGEDTNPLGTVADILRLSRENYNVFMYVYDYQNPFEDLVDGLITKVKKLKADYRIQDDMTFIPYSYGTVIYRGAVLSPGSGNVFSGNSVIPLAPVAGGVQDVDNWAQYFHRPSWFYMTMKGTWVKRKDIHAARALNPYDAIENNLFSDENTAQFNKKVKLLGTLLPEFDDESLRGSTDNHVLQMYKNGVGLNYEVIEKSTHENLPNSPKAITKLGKLLGIPNAAMIASVIEDEKNVEDTIQHNFKTIEEKLDNVKATQKLAGKVQIRDALVRLSLTPGIKNATAYILNFLGKHGDFTKLADQKKWLAFVKWMSSKFILSIDTTTEDPTELHAETQKLIEFIKQQNKEHRGVTIDNVGDASASEKDAQNYQNYYRLLMDALKEEPIQDVPDINLSIKFSGLVYQYEKIALYRGEGVANQDTDAVAKAREIKERLKELLIQGGTIKDRPFFMRIDLEEYAYRDATMQIFKEAVEELMRDNPQAILAEDGHTLKLGVVVQAYLKDSYANIVDLEKWGQKNGIIVPIRLVKGAYERKEKEWARKGGYDSPVFRDKESTDRNYEVLSAYLLKNADHFKLAFGTHNLRSISAIMVLARHFQVDQSRFEFQMLYGMGEVIQQMIVQSGYKFRMYLPAGTLARGLGYAGRRFNELSDKTSALVQALLGKYNLIREKPEYQKDDNPIDGLVTRSDAEIKNMVKAIHNDKAMLIDQEDLDMAGTGDAAMAKTRKSEKRSLLENNFNEAMVTQDFGGIDLNTKNMGLNIVKDGQGISMRFDPAMLAQFRRGDFSGIVPVIIRVTPIASVLPMLGLNTSPAIK